MKTTVSNSDLKIGIVDDDNLFTIMTEKELFQRDFTKFKTYASGEEYFSDATSDFDILILDYHLDSINAQAMDGLEILKRIKKNNFNTKVIMMSSDDDVKVAEDALKFGANEYIVKSKTASARLELSLNSIKRTVQMKKEMIEEKREKIKMTIIYLMVFVALFGLNYLFPGIFNEK